MKIKQEEFDRKERKLVFKEGKKQILLLEIAGQIYALDNRCPHEGYPLSQGDVDEGKGLLTCNWHNWKFDLKTGKCLIGADHVRTYPVRIHDSEIEVDTSDPSPEQMQKMILEGLKTGFDKRQYGRMARELARLDFSGIDPVVAIEKAISWSYQKFEYGMTHAYAALADWLALYNQNRQSWRENEDEQARELSLLCLTEGLEHMAFDSLRHPDFPFTKEIKKFKEAHFLAAVESEDELAAISMINGAFQEGLSFQDLYHALATAALNHYNDFGHSLIYVHKANSLSQFFKNSNLDHQLAQCLTRSLVYATREDLLPEFKAYGPCLERLNGQNFGDQQKVSLEDEKRLQGQRAGAAMKTLVELAPSYTPKALYDMLLGLNSLNMLSYDFSYQEQTHNPVTQNVGWLDYTHALTFSNAVRAVSEKDAEFWKKGLLQVAAFYGRNTPYLMDVEVADWKVDDCMTFKSSVMNRVYDHGLATPILSAHLLKTGVACFEEIHKGTSEKTQVLLLSSLNRFLNSPLKAKHARRLVHQGMALVRKDFM